MLPRPGSDDNTTPPDYALSRFYDICTESFNKMYGFDLDYISHLPRDLEAEGFVNVQTKIFHVPIGDWPRDPHLRTIGGYLREVVMDFAIAMAARPFVELGMEKSEIDELLYAVRDCLGNHSIHAHLPIHFVWAQKPLETSTSSA